MVLDYFKGNIFIHESVSMVFVYEYVYVQYCALHKIYIWSLRWVTYISPMYLDFLQIFWLTAPKILGISQA